MPPTLHSASGPRVELIAPVLGSPSHLHTWLFDAETSDDSCSDAFCLNPSLTTSTTSAKPGSELETIIDSDCEFNCSTPTPGPISTPTHMWLIVTEPETKSNCKPYFSTILSLANLLDDPGSLNTLYTESPLSDLGPELANSELPETPLHTEVNFVLCHKICALKHYAHWPYHQIATATGVLLSTPPLGMLLNPLYPTTQEAHYLSDLLSQIPLKTCQRDLCILVLSPVLL
ncbi:hypothetical protein C7212DRAFT_361375 [Tuber magnatum]|uniref:Uncharacterized protein n=1 Tax=Tuber magnatum TaxID=42249 RepID=A0A317T2H1_9PEZI|nr:hypothetical protein C7212DRAFT_361375 [Tuber magnatum]